MDLERSLRRLAIEEATSRIARVVEDTEDGYTLEWSDGGQISASGSQLSERFEADTWVTVERSGSSWYVVGISPYKAG